MALFTYRAVDSTGRIVAGRIDALNLVDLEMRLKRMELDLINGKPVSDHVLFGGSVPRRELIHFCFHLELLIRAGVPILEGLTDLRDSVENPRFREIIASLIESIEGGQKLSEAMEKHPKIFDKVFVSLIGAGETMGKLPEVLLRMTETLKWEDEVASHVKKLLMYPAFVSVIVLGVTFFLMAYLVPKLKLFIGNMGQPIETQTKILFFVSDALVAYWYIVLLLPIMLVFLLKLLIEVNPLARARFDSIKLKIPLTGAILRKIILSRFANTFAILYASGIPIIESIRITQGIVGNESVRSGLERVEQMIGEGQNVTTSFQSVDLFPPLVIRMLRVGENTGSLDTSLMNVNYFYNRDVKESVEKMQEVIKLLPTVVLGVLLGWIMLSILGPVYDIITKIGV
ncbi:MAG: type II secretion system F family protein [Candidatus Accumulibacter sp.]|jgi:type IV pilus assembly protein PilC|nr:type II secretion system F family protein [Accumulibacter sp.]